MNRLVPLAVVLVGCVQPVEAPVAQIAAVDGKFASGDVVMLDGSGSRDPNKLELVYLWSFQGKPANSAAAFNDNTLALSSFVPDEYGEYTVGLVVDNGVLTSELATAIVTVDACGNEVPVIEEITATADPITGTAVQVGAVVVDADAACGRDQELDWRWSLVSRPAGSNATLNDARSLDPSFLADRPGDYTVRLDVIDETGREAEPETLVVTVSGCGDAAPTVSVAATPTAPAAGEATTLEITWEDADNSTCGLAQAVTVSSEIVQAPAGSTASLVPAGGDNPGFVPDRMGSYTIRTTVTDDTGRVGWVDTVVTTDGVCGAQAPVASLAIIDPVAEGPSDALVATSLIRAGDPVQFDAGTSSDPDFDANGCNVAGTLSYHWSFTGMASGSSTAFNDPALRNASFIADAPGEYEVLLVVEDELGLVDTATAVLTVVPGGIAGVLPGYFMEVVDGFSGLWNNPEGVTVDDNGFIYVVQDGADWVTRTDPALGTTTIFSAGGSLGNTNLSDIEWYAPDSVFFMSVDVFGSGFDDHVLSIDASGNQSRFTSLGEMSQPRGLHVYTNANGNDRLLVVDRNNDRVRVFDPTDTAPANNVGSLGFGGVFNGAWGVAATVDQGQEVVYVTDDNQDELWRDDGNLDLLSDIFNSPADVEIAGNGIVVADENNGILWLVDDCNNPRCQSSALVVGGWDPFGLAWESSTSLLITDNNNDVLYRLTGPF